MESFETFEHAGFVCELYQDEEPSAPSEWDELGTLYAFEPRNSFVGMEDADGDVRDAWERDRPGLTVRYARAVRGEVAVLYSLQDFGSSGLSLRVLDADKDGSATGYIATTRERCEELGAPWEDAGRQLRGELENWRAFFAGEVVGFFVRDPETGKVEDSIWGFYPDPDDGGDGNEDVRAEARSAAESVRDAREARRLEVARGWALAHGLEGVAA